MKLWVSMIVKNEESCLERCLESVKGVDGIVIADTGSVDRTVEIASRYTTHVSVGEYQWDDNFAEARNFALSKIPEVEDYWVLSIDADNVLKPGGVTKIRESIDRYSDKRSISVTLRSMSGSSHHQFPNIFRKGVKWVGRVHNHLDVSEANHSDVVITYGYSEAHKKDPNRALRMLRKATFENRTPRNLYYLAREYLYRREYQAAIDLYEECANKSKWVPERSDAYLSIARCYVGLEMRSEALIACAHAVATNANFKEALVLMADLSGPANKSQWQLMIDSADNRDVLFVRG
jgi:glycosyltransferase involved in cell wall biosynthesis